MSERIESGTREAEMELDPLEISKARQMANEGKSVGQISKELSLDYWEVWKHVPRSWQGTKWVITNRLKSLVKEADRGTRDRMVSEVAECVQYLYDRGRHMGKQIERARDTLNG